MTYYQMHKERLDIKSKRYREKNREKIYAKAKEWNDSEHGKAWRKQYAVRRYQDKKRYIQTYLMQHPCVDCGNDDQRVLEFDHVNGYTKGGIRSAAMWSLDRFVKEIEKCEIRCANCHRIRHVNDKAQRAWQRRNAVLQ